MKNKLIMIIICSLLLVGCKGDKIERNLIKEPIYESDYSGGVGQEISLEALLKEMEGNGIEVDGYNSDPDFKFEEYYFQVENMNVNIFTRQRSKSVDSPVLQRIRIHLADTHPEKTQIHENEFFKSLMKFIEGDEISDWVKDQEDRYGELRGKSVLSDTDEIAEIIAVGRTYISFVGTPLYDDKQLEIVWDNWDDMPEEFLDLAAEFEHQGLFITEYEKGFKGNRIKLESGPYHLIESGKSKDRGVKIRDASNIVAYKIMYDPNSSYNYSSQLYGFIAEDSAESVKIEDMVGIDTISRVMGMSWDDFNDVTSSLNKELSQARKDMENRLRGDYSLEGEASGYQYQVYAEMYSGFNRFTVLIEKI